MQVGICEVHRRLDGDTTPRWVEWCGACQAWICATCWSDWWRRARAALGG
jgi:hypothetical protein